MLHRNVVMQHPACSIQHPASSIPRSAHSPWRSTWAAFFDWDLAFQRFSIFAESGNSTDLVYPPSPRKSFAATMISSETSSPRRPGIGSAPSIPSQCLTHNGEAVKREWMLTCRRRSLELLLSAKLSHHQPCRPEMLTLYGIRPLALGI